MNLSDKEKSSESVERQKILAHWSECLAFLQGDSSSDIVFQGIRYGKDRSKDSKVFDQTANVAVINIEGTLYQKSFSSWFFGDFAGYDTIQQSTIEALKDPTVDAVLLNINSRGGEVAGLFDTALAIKQGAKAFDKPLVAFVGETATSAAYGLACAAELIIVPQTGVVGSIGVVATTVDQSEALAKYGIKFNVITSGKAKADAHPAFPLSAEARARIQEQVNQLFDIFAQWVSQSRGLTIESISALEAQTFIGQRAIDLQLGDRLGTVGDGIYTASRLGKKRKERRQMATLLENIVEIFKMDSNTTEEKALDKLKAMKLSNESMADSLEKQRTELDAKERDKLIAQGEAQGKVTKAMKDNVFPKMSTDLLKVTLENAPRIIPVSSDEETKVTSELKYKGKTFAELSSQEKHDLHVLDNKLYQAMKNPERK